MIKSIIFPLILSFAGIELLLYFWNIPGWRGAVFDSGDQAWVHPDNELGWVHTPGTFEAHYLDFKPFKITIWNDGSRATRENESIKKRSLLFTGCSFTEGLGLDDQNTIPWRVQQSYPEVDVRNLGTAGYGTSQALGFLKRKMEFFAAPEAVLYGFAEFHEIRNFDTPMSHWSFDGNVDLLYPVCRTENRALVCATRPGYRPFFLSYFSRLVALTEEAATATTVLLEKKQIRHTTELLILEMKQVVEKVGARFLVFGVSLSEKAGNEYGQFFKDNSIDWINCAKKDEQNLFFPDGHPNVAGANTFARCIEPWIDNVAKERSS